MKPEDLPGLSMSAVKAYDRERWLSLFEDDAVVEDPVGGFDPWDMTGEGQRGKEAIGKFFDMFSAAQKAIDFDVHYLVGCADEAAAFTTMTITMKDDSVHTKQMINIYRMSPAGKIASLRAFWN